MYTYGFLKTENVQFGVQARSFLEGRTNIPKSIDTVNFNGKYYWHQAPFPSVILIPFIILFGDNVNERIVQALVVCVLVTIVFKLARLNHFNRYDSIYLTINFIFGSAMIGLVTNPSSWYFAQVLGTTLLALLLFEYETQKRYWLMGFLLALIIVTRQLASLFGLLIFAEYIKEFLAVKSIPKALLAKIAVFTVPGLIAIAALLWFNQTRFGDPLFSTYQTADVYPLLKPAQELGIFSMRHISLSVYYYFLASVQPVLDDGSRLVFPFITYNPFGFSFFLISPFFIYAFRSLKDNRLTKYWLIIALTLIPLMTFFGMAGYWTFGPRYTADFMPILFLLLIKSFQKPCLGFDHKLLIFISGALNIYLALSPRFIYGW